MTTASKPTFATLTAEEVKAILTAPPKTTHTGEPGKDATPHELLWGEGAETHGQYLVRADDDLRYIYPKNRDGKSMRVTLARYYLHLKHETNITNTPCVTFKRHRHQGRWLWSDSRSPEKPVTRKYVFQEVARMLFGGDERAADPNLARWLQCGTYWIDAHLPD